MPREKPSILNAIVQVMGKDAIDAQVVLERLEHRAWGPTNTDDPRGYVGYILASRTRDSNRGPALFERAEGRRGIYRVINPPFDTVAGAVMLTTPPKKKRTAWDRVLDGDLLKGSPCPGVTAHKRPLKCQRGEGHKGRCEHRRKGTQGGTIVRWWGVNTRPKGDLEGMDRSQLVDEIGRLRDLLRCLGYDWEKDAL